MRLGGGETEKVSVTIATPGRLVILAFALEQSSPFPLTIWVATSGTSLQSCHIDLRVLMLSADHLSTALGGVRCCSGPFRAWRSR